MAKAILSWVPTPSVLETRTGWRELPGVEGKQAAEAAPPGQHLAAARGGQQPGQVALTWLPRSMSTPRRHSFLLHLSGMLNAK